MFVRKKKNKSGRISVQIILLLSKDNIEKLKTNGYAFIIGARVKTAYAIYKELERLLNNHRAGFSAARAIELTQNMYEMAYQLPNSQKQKTKYLKMDEEQRILFDIIKNS